eukprot:TRINITY_DN3240_c0_g3_i1.p1 TRINITY_DN3240_c0_g3~~TRINITY_DN3240_c0_g3_i1.p1  ORF type:complete len:521 (+),score=45.97 TRINITY_DN3240_c0_g3_i1:60-1622(+)
MISLGLAAARPHMSAVRRQKRIQNRTLYRSSQTKANSGDSASLLLRLLQDDDNETSLDRPPSTNSSSATPAKQFRAPKLKQSTRTLGRKKNIDFTPSEATIKTSSWYARLQGGEAFSSPALQRLYLEWLSSLWGFKTLEDWYQVTRQRILEAPFGFQFLNSTGNASLNDIFKSLWPQHDWIPWKWPSVRQDVWTPQAQRQYFLSRVKGENLDSLYELTRQEVDKEAGTTLLQQYASFSSPLQAALRECFPEHKWLSWRFHPLPIGYWDSRQSQREYLQFFIESRSKKGRSVDFSSWHSVSPADLASDATGASILRHFGGSLIRALQSAFPEHEWCEWHFSTVPVGFWTTATNRRRFLDWFARHGLPEAERFDPTNPNSFSAWYRVKVASVRACGGRGLLAQTNYSLYKALKDAYPEFTFEATKFVYSTKRAGAKIATDSPLHLQESKTERQILLDAAKSLEISDMSQWYGISARQAISAGARFVEKHYGSSLPRALAAAFPEHEWQLWKFERAPRGLFSS